MCTIHGIHCSINTLRISINRITEFFLFTRTLGNVTACVSFFVIYIIYKLIDYSGTVPNPNGSTVLVTDTETSDSLLIKQLSLQSLLCTCRNCILIRRHNPAALRVCLQTAGALRLAGGKIGIFYNLQDTRNIILCRLQSTNNISSKSYFPTNIRTIETSV